MVSYCMCPQESSFQTFCSLELFFYPFTGGMVPVSMTEWPQSFASIDEWLEKCLQHFPFVIWDLRFKGIISFWWIETRITGNSGGKGLGCDWRPCRGKLHFSGTRNPVLAPGDKPNTILWKQRNDVEKWTRTMYGIRITREQQRPSTHFQKGPQEQSVHNNKFT